MKKGSLLIFGLILLMSCDRQQQQHQMGAQYKTLTVELSDRTLETGYTAKLRGRQYVEVRPQVSGIITDIRINEGDAVKKGQTLFIIRKLPEC